MSALVQVDRLRVGKTCEAARCVRTIQLAAVVFLAYGCTASISSGGATPESQPLSTNAVADWTNRDTTLRFERLILPSSVRSLVVIYSVPDGTSGSIAGDTVTYTVPSSGVVYSSRRIPALWVETHLFRPDSPMQYREILVTRNCDLHRVATRNYPGQTFGCWMPLVVSPVALRTYMSATISDSAGLESAYNSTILLMNREAFANRMLVVPTWSEPSNVPPAAPRRSEGALRNFVRFETSKFWDADSRWPRGDAFRSLPFLGWG
jgi:hypothetical protein